MSRGKGAAVSHGLWFFGRGGACGSCGAKRTSAGLATVLGAAPEGATRTRLCGLMALRVKRRADQDHTRAEGWRPSPQGGVALGERAVAPRALWSFGGGCVRVAARRLRALIGADAVADGSLRAQKLDAIHTTAASYPLPLSFLAPPFFALGTASAPHRT